jgi:hypothetical protein
VVGQSCDHRAGFDFWHKHMVAVLLYTGNIPDFDLGIGAEAAAHAGGIQHHLGMDFVYGSSTTSSININMSEQFLLPMARNTRTGETVKTQDLSGVRYALNQRVLAEFAADQCAAQMTARTGDTWRGFVRTYTPSERR